MRAASQLSRREQLRYHGAVVAAHFKTIRRALHALLFSLPGLIRALLGR